MRNVVHEIADGLLPPINSIGLIYAFDGETGYSIIDQLIIINSLICLLYIYIAQWYNLVKDMVRYSAQLILCRRYY